MSTATICAALLAVTSPDISAQAPTVCPAVVDAQPANPATPARRATSDADESAPPRGNQMIEAWITRDRTTGTPVVCSPYSEKIRVLRALLMIHRLDRIEVHSDRVEVIRGDHIVTTEIDLSGYGNGTGKGTCIVAAAEQAIRELDAWDA